MHTNAHTRARTHIQHTHTCYVCGHTRIHVPTCVHTHVHAYTRAYQYMRTRAYTCACMCKHAHPHVRIYAHMHAHTCVHIHAHAHTEQRCCCGHNRSTHTAHAKRTTTSHAAITGALQCTRAHQMFTSHHIPHAFSAAHCIRHSCLNRRRTSLVTVTKPHRHAPVSYTHLTLPTIYSV